MSRGGGLAIKKAVLPPVDVRFSPDFLEVLCKLFLGEQASKRPLRGDISPPSMSDMLIDKQEDGIWKGN